MLYKFRSNLNFKTDGNFVNMWNSVTTTAPPPASFSGLPDTPMAALGFALARRRPLRVISLLSWPLYKAQTPSPTFLSLLCFSRRPCSTPASSHRRCSASTVVAKCSIALPTPCAPSHPTMVALFCREPAVRTLLHDRQPHRRKRISVASALQ